MDPVEAHRAATDKPTRRRLQREIVCMYRGRVEAMARRFVPSANVEAGTQVGCVGLLLALEKYEGEGDAFWWYAAGRVRVEIEKWYAACLATADRPLSAGRRAG
jgi:DNA-directed RNA polymerase specialized sigma subunit